MPAQQSGASSVDKTSAERTLVIKRTFDAPRELVWKAWTDVKHAKQWWGPKGFTAPLVELDNREGGPWRARMRSPDGKDYWQHGVTREIVPPERLSFTFIWDEHPEEEMLVTVTLVERGGMTEMTFRQEGFKSVEERDGHAGGWNESFDRLVAFLKKAKSAT
jgi:uncharacterized protein YndB with AHSA1/START domain